jgi:hydrogenase-4 component B
LTIGSILTAGLTGAFAIRLVAIGVSLLLRGRPALCRFVSLAGSLVASAMTLRAALHVVRARGAVEGVLLHHAASGIEFGYQLTPLSAWFLLVLGVVAIPVTVYSAAYFTHAVSPRRTATVGMAFNSLLGAVELVFAAADVLTFLFAWELMTLATAILVATEHQERASRRAAYLYLVMSHVGTGCLVAGFFVVSAAAGSTSFATMFVGNLAEGPLRHALFALFFVGFGVKAGIVPLHVWLPEAHPAAPSSISALMSAVLVTAGVYGLVRVCAFGLGTPHVYWALACLLLGSVSAVLGVLYALTQTDIKRLLAYSTIENTGIIVLGLGAGMMAMAYGRGDLAAVAVTASLAHVLNHAAFKSLLFLGAGNVVAATGTRNIEELGGLLHRMPWTGLFFLTGAMAISGLPLLNGFVSEWLTFQALLFGFASTPGLMRLNFPLAGAMLALTTALAAACFVRAFGISFLARPRTRVADEAHEAPAIMLVPQAFLAVLCLALGLFPGAVLGAIGGSVVSLPGIQLQTSFARNPVSIVSGIPSFDYVVPALLGIAFAAALLVSWIVTTRQRFASRRAPTWGCGGELTASTEYTATAFSKPVMMIFRGVYRPTREVEALAEVSPYFPHEVRYRARIEPTFERYVYGPIVRGVLKVAAGMKVLQAGSLHAYLAYVLLLTVALLLWLGGKT